MNATAARLFYTMVELADINNLCRLKVVVDEEWFIKCVRDDSSNLARVVAVEYLQVTLILLTQDPGPS